MKVCTKCKERKQLLAFPTDNSKRDGLHSHCRKCHSDRKKFKRINDPEWVKKERAKSKAFRTKYPERVKTSIVNATLKAKYGISLADYNRRLADQGEVCAICKCPCITGHRLSVDHNHETGEIRGLLCVNCNRAVGHMRDNPALLRVAADYLEGRYRQ